MLPASRSAWNDPRVLFLLLMVFLAGAVSGALTMRAGLHERLHHGTSLWRADPQLSYEKMKKDLNLTPDQAEKLKEILDDMVKYREDMQAEVESFRATGKHRILDMLTPEQRKTFERLSDDMPTR
jgi:Spy/CpxP family protein refolding chaperone